MINAETMKTCGRFHGFKSLYSSVLSVVLIFVLVGNLYIIPETVRDICQSQFNCRPKIKPKFSVNCSTGSDTQHLTSLTMFTTFPFVKNKFDINRNTLQNWKHIYNSPKLILFTGDQKVASAGIKSDWSVQNIKTEPVTEVPALRTLFLESIKRSKTQLYLYANADILFDRYLIEILSSIAEFLKSSDLQSEPVLIVGQRTNVNLSSIDSQGPDAWKKILHHSYTVYTRFQKNAIDYFITNEVFPWKEVPELVIGRVGYDNWIIAYARFRGFVTIDASSVISAIHQTSSNGNFEGFQNGNWDFNRELIKKTYPPFNYGIWGQTDCCRYRVMYDDCSRVQVLKQQDLPAYCDKLNFIPYVTHSLFGTDVHYMGYKQGS
ncbi:uncharacterized protein LOC117343598 [Pecten maximus]|uniref:uncharacterized protein LOC117343598 n=1 Tax=Pecten maximus TaxID=6579 RepID=UPI001458BBA0|nr:uncharacterized protein LOC117343598 [Pecten maximus]